MEEDFSRSTRFLEAFRCLETVMRKIAGSAESAPFQTNFETASKRNGIVQRYKSKIEVIAKLRNSITHGNYGNLKGKAIAEPHRQIVKELEDIVRILETPPSLISLAQKPLWVEASTPIGTAAKQMHDMSFSQLPILKDERFSGVLTENAIVRWIGANVDADLVILSETMVEEVAEFADQDIDYRFEARTKDVGSILDIFDEDEHQGKRLVAVFITETGKKTETLLGILTVSDYPRLLSSLKLPR